jgi:uncharacterized protein
MRLIVSQIPENGFDQECILSMALNDSNKENDIQVHIKVNRYGERVFVKGNAQATVVLDCSRCLKGIAQPVKINFDAEYIPLTEGTNDEEYELNAQELDIAFYKDDEINITDIVREQLLLAIPMKPLCREDCRGMCEIF